MGKAVRLDKFLADAGIGTRSEVKKYIQKGQIQINGMTIKRPETKVEPGKDEVSQNGAPIGAAPEYVYYLLYKPAGCVSATTDSREKTVMEYVPGGRKGLFPVGRLDKDTEGLLLITDDGPLAHELLSPRKHVAKTYYARLQGVAAEEDVQAMKEGVDIGEEKPTLPAELEILSVDLQNKTSEIRLTICEGKFHQVKRMMEAVGKKVTYLKRISMGTLTLGEELLPGEYRELTAKEVETLKKKGKNN